MESSIPKSVFDDLSYNWQISYFKIFNVSYFKIFKISYFKIFNISYFNIFDISSNSTNQGWRVLSRSLSLMISVITGKHRLISLILEGEWGNFLSRLNVPATPTFIVEKEILCSFYLSKRVIQYRIQNSLLWGSYLCRAKYKLLRWLHCTGHNKYHPIWLTNCSRMSLICCILSVRVTMESV